VKAGCDRVGRAVQHKGKVYPGIIVTAIGGRVDQDSMTLREGRNRYTSTPGAEPTHPRALGRRCRRRPRACSISDGRRLGIVPRHGRKPAGDASADIPRRVLLEEM